ncbi:hypothetical protein CP533_5482 [Ophiocordyceps camponoti-saundersi (nom. inval.)]|nr:hypothetical protein CP533_5482 [Ophiocordyceps camponoti-saundersi (nom. inval.)]
MSLSRMASVFIGRETMVRLDEVDALHPSVENDEDRDDALDWDPLQGSGEGPSINKINVPVIRSKSASARPKTRMNSSQASTSQAREGFIASANHEKKRGRPKGSTKKTFDKVDKGMLRRSGRVRSAPESFAPASTI